MDYNLSSSTSNMRINIPVGFKVGSPTPIDSRSVVENPNDLYAISNANLAYYGLKVYCKSDACEYRYTTAGWENTTSKEKFQSFFTAIDPEYDSNGVVTMYGSLSINLNTNWTFNIRATEAVLFETTKSIQVNGAQMVSIDAKVFAIGHGPLQVQNSAGTVTAPMNGTINGNLIVTHNLKSFNMTIDNSLTLTKPVTFSIGGVDKTFDGHTTVAFSHSDITTVLDDTSGYNLAAKLKAKAGNAVAYATLTVAGWAGTAAPYTQSATFAGITDENPTLVSGLADGATAAIQAAYVKAFGIVCSGTGTFNTSTKVATFKVYKKPATDVRVGLKG